MSLTIGDMWFEFQAAQLPRTQRLQPGAAEQQQHNETSLVHESGLEGRRNRP